MERKSIYKVAFWTLWSVVIAVLGLIGGMFMVLTWIMGGG